MGFGADDVCSSVRSGRDRTGAGTIGRSHNGHSGRMNGVPFDCVVRLGESRSLSCAPQPKRSRGRPRGAGGIERRHGAILAADAVGYSRPMGDGTSVEFREAGPPV